MRIVFVLAVADNGGGVRTVAMYGRLLSERGHDVTVISAPFPEPTLKARVSSVVRGRGWPQHPRRGDSHVDRARLDHRRLDRFRAVTDRDVPDADVVVATWWETAEWVAALSPRKGAKVHFIQGHESDLPGQPQARVAATWRLRLQRIVCSRWLLDLARDRYGDEGAVLVPNGVDLEQFSTPPRDKQERPAIGFVYADSWIKGCDVAIGAFEGAAKRVPALRLVTFASGPVSPELPLPRRAEFRRDPDQSEIPTLYASCDAWLWPSRSEGFGLPILEAMACRTPVIAAPAGAAPDILADGGGVLLPAADPLAMAEAIERVVLSSPADWRRLSQQARSVAARYSWHDSARLFEAALERAAAARTQL